MSRNWTVEMIKLWYRYRKTGTLGTSLCVNVLIVFVFAVDMTKIRLV